MSDARRSACSLKSAGHGSRDRLRDRGARAASGSRKKFRCGDRGRNCEGRTPGASGSARAGPLIARRLARSVVDLTCVRTANCRIGFIRRCRNIGRSQGREYRLERERVGGNRDHDASPQSAGPEPVHARIYLCGIPYHHAVHDSIAIEPHQFTMRVGPCRTDVLRPLEGWWRKLASAQSDIES